LLLIPLCIFIFSIVPAVANNYLVNQYPVPEALATTIKQRKAYHEKWDIEKGVTMEKFYAHYPQYRKYPLPDKNFSWLWYYAMQQMGDDESRPESESMKQKLSQREDAAALISRFIPAMHAQHQLNNIAQSGLCNHIQFLDSTTRFHEKLRLHFYPKIFENHPVRAVDWKAYDVQYFSMNNKIDWVMICMPLVLFITILFVLGWLRIKYPV
jgi:ABC-2 type transport system permease protein